jgi:hypothetical protein
MPHDSGAIDNAILDVLSGDATLAALAPDGVFFEEARHGSTCFICCSLEESVDDATFGPRRIESALYLVAIFSRAGAATASDVHAAETRIDVLLDDAVLTVPGYDVIHCFREGRVRTTRRDPLDASVLWYLRGGRYRVAVAVPD